MEIVHSDAYTSLQRALLHILSFFQPIRVSGKTGIPKDVLGKGLTAAALKQLDRENDLVDRIEAEQKERENSNSTYSSDENDVDETMTLASRVSKLSVRNKHESKGKRHALKK